MITKCYTVLLSNIKRDGPKYDCVLSPCGERTLTPKVSIQIQQSHYTSGIPISFWSEQRQFQYFFQLKKPPLRLNLPKSLLETCHHREGQAIISLNITMYLQGNLHFYENADKGEASAEICIQYTCTYEFKAQHHFLIGCSHCNKLRKIQEWYLTVKEYPELQLIQL